MALSDTDTWQNHTVTDPEADAITTAFPFIAATDIVVKNLTQRVTLAEGVDYDTTGGGAVAGGGYTTGTITLISATNMAADDWLFIERVTALTQSVDLTAHDNLPSSTLENALDRAMMIAQEAERDRRKWVESLFIGDVDTDLATGDSQAIWENRTGNSVHLHDVTAGIVTSPTDASLLVQVQNPLADVYASPITILTAQTKDDGTQAFDTTVPVVVTNNSRILIDIEQVGSTVAGSLLHLTLHLFDTGS